MLNNQELFFVKEESSDKVLVASFNGQGYDTGDGKIKPKMEVVGKVPPEVVKVAKQGVKIINMTKLLNRKER